MLQRIQVDAETILQVSVSGSGEPVVFIHGLGGNLSFWAGQARALSQHFTVVRYDLRGHGGSSPSTNQALFTHVKDLRALLKTLAIPKAHLVGLSLGGIIAQAFAGQFQVLVRRLVLASTTSSFPRKGKAALHALATVAREQGMQAVAESFAIRLFGHEVTLEDTSYQALAAAFLTQDRASFAATAEMLAEADVTPLLHRISAKTLLCYAANDRQTPPTFGEHLESHIMGSELHVFENAGHVFPLEIPQEFNQRLLDFLGSS
ncbi:MAG: alpha/beta fold hydrolase [Blastocatellia bacterium]|nr:alpha/beta fold hydrolase [Blastocatellia bacterium]